MCPALGVLHSPLLPLPYVVSQWAPGPALPSPFLALQGPPITLLPKDGLALLPAGDALSSHQGEQALGDFHAGLAPSISSWSSTLTCSLGSLSPVAILQGPAGLMLALS